MVDPTPALARAVLRKNLRLKRGESVIFESWDHTLPYIGAFVDEARRIGARPTVLYEDNAAWWRAAKAKWYAPFRHLSAAEKAAIENADAYLYFWGPADMKRAMGSDSSAGDRLTAFNDEWYAAARKAGLRGCRMSLGLASDPTAERFGLSGPEWRDRIIAAGAVDAHKMLVQARRLSAKLERGSELRIRHANGTDLRLSLAGARSRISTGIPTGPSKANPFGVLDANPSGQVLTAVEQSEPEGTLISNRPVYDMVHYERSAGVRWTFRGGQLAEHSISDGREAFESAYAEAPPARDRLTYISIGLNPAARELAPCEDTEEGVILVGIGGNRAAGGKIRIPFTGYAMVGGATLTVDGDPIARGGRIL